MVIAKMGCVMLTCSHVRIYIAARLAEAVCLHVAAYALACVRPMIQHDSVSERDDASCRRMQGPMIQHDSNI